ncbi:hypothetical protein D9Q98_008116 [Chlorella vulgaris]|uniref:Peptidase M14 domain-containing protein n=1 Tax=Chlorella vulgaris TaxID=3077 RepID=A0A9D4TG21_CHLVU|nr:hypothetical protein D9Q98_008116 [Chlorella vulgaris]
MWPQRVLLAALLLSLCAWTDARIKFQTPLQQVLSRQFTNAELAAHMRRFSTRCANISRLHTIGSSVRGEPLLALEISSSAGSEDAKPHFKCIANMHGDETGGRQLLLALAEWLCANYAVDAAARTVVTKTHLWLLPTMNPDGFAAGTRANANGVDLNRNFPDRFGSPPLALTGLEQPETLAVMNWTLSRQFTASANMHEGALVVNYPFDNTADGSSVYSKAQDDAALRYLAKVYANRNPQLKTSPVFPGGITNGAAWYNVNGGMQDWNYLKAGCFELTLELWEDKGGADLQVLFDNNLLSMLDLVLRSTLGGLRGKVRRQGTGAPLEAKIRVIGSTTMTTSTKKFGDFYRPLAPSATPYLVAVRLPGRTETRLFNVTIPASGAGVSLAVTFP